MQLLFDKRSGFAVWPPWANAKTNPLDMLVRILVGRGKVDLARYSIHPDSPNLHPKAPYQRAPRIRGPRGTSPPSGSLLNKRGEGRGYLLSPLTPPGLLPGYTLPPSSAFPTVTVRCLAFLDSTLGRVMVSTPLSKLGLAWSVSTDSGSRSERTKEPERRSRTM